MADNSGDFAAIYQTDERADAWAREKLRRQERVQASTATLMRAADLHTGDSVWKSPLGQEI